MTVKKNMCYRTQITPLGIYLHYGFSKKKNKEYIRIKITVVTVFEFTPQKKSAARLVCNHLLSEDKSLKHLHIPKDSLLMP